MHAFNRLLIAVLSIWSAVLLTCSAAIPVVAEDDVPQVLRQWSTVYCSGDTEETYRCGDGTRADSKGGLAFDGSAFDPAKNATKQIILTVTAKVEHRVCTGGGRYTNCGGIDIYPETDFLTAASKEDCATLGRTIAYRKWHTLLLAGHRSTVSYTCD